MPIRTADFVLSARWIVPMTARDQVLREHALVVREGKILGIFPLPQALREHSGVLLVERPAHVLLPGLVNSHTHAAMSLFRGMAENLPLMRWLNELIWPLERRLVTAEFVRDGSLLSIAEMLRAGVTCFGDMYFFPDQTAKAAIDQGMRAQVGTPIAEFPSPWATTPDEYLNKALEVHDEFRGESLIRTAFAPHAPYTVGDATFRRLKTLADEIDSPIVIHLHESAGEIEDSLAQYGKRPIDRLEGLGILSPALNAVHMAHANDADIDRAVRNGISITMCPESNLKLGNGAPRVAAWAASGAPLAIGTDGPASNNDQDPWGEMKLAALLARGGAGSFAAMDARRSIGEGGGFSPWDALALGTRGGARALGLEQDIGTLEAGKWADLCCVDLGYAATWPVYDPLAQLIYSSSRNQVSDVWVAGRHLLAKGEYTHLDWKEVAEKAARWAETLSDAAQEKS